MTTTLARPAAAGRASLSREGTVAVAVAAASVLSVLAAVVLLTARSAWGLPGLESTVVDVAAAVSLPVTGGPRARRGQRQPGAGPVVAGHRGGRRGLRPHRGRGRDGDSGGPARGRRRRGERLD